MTDDLDIWLPPLCQLKYQFIVNYFVLELKCPIRIPQAILSLCHWLSIYPGNNRNETVELLKKSCSKFLHNRYKSSSPMNGIVFTDKSWISLVLWDHRDAESKAVELKTFNSQSFESKTLFALFGWWTLVVSTQIGDINIQSMSQLVWHLKETL